MEKLDPSYSPSSFFFDYLMDGGLGGVIDIISRDFTITKEDIDILESKGKFIPREKSSGFIFLHHFGTLHQWWNSHEECILAIRNSLDESLAKFSHLGAKTQQLLSGGQRVGLVFAGQEPGERFRQLQELLQSKYGRDHLIVNVLERGQEHSVDDGSVLNLFVDDALSPKKGTPQAWQGWDDTWFAALSKIPLIPA
ncbi:MAG: hypothetical protein WCZ23_14465 [Rhodospirillaceae bacterium]